jgi:hypothetical protein
MVLLLLACAEPRSGDTALDTGGGAARTAAERVLAIGTDNGADGRIDRTLERTFDAAGDPILEREDRDGDGVFEREAVFATFRESGRIVRIEADEDGDGQADSVETRAYDARGRQVRATHRADGRPERVEETRWSGATQTVRRFAGGRLLGETSYTEVDGGVEVDLDGDGRADNRMARWWQHGLLAEIRTDAGADGDIDGVTSYAYDADNQLIRITIDADGDGAPDTLVHRSWR